MAGQQPTAVARGGARNQADVEVISIATNTPGRDDISMSAGEIELGIYFRTGRFC